MRGVVNPDSVFQSFFMGGFECSTHRLRSGKRLDEIGATQHDRFAREDYLRLRSQGMLTARDGLRWHLIESRQGHYDFSSVVPLINAARETNTQIVWDLCHYGWPEWLDIYSPDFIDAFGNLAGEFARLWKNETDEILYAAPINEISFFSWGAGDSGYLNPFSTGKGNQIKSQLVRAAIAGVEALWAEDSRTRVAHVDPLIHVLPANPANSKDVMDANAYRESQFEAWDMLAGRRNPELGGQEKYLDIIGGNYYVHNQWILGGSFIDQANPRYRPFRDIVTEVYERYQRPVFIAETGIEDDLRPAWFRYVCDEVRAAIERGVEVEGICLYPIVNHPGWDDDRHCHNGLWDYPNEAGEREIYQPLAAELKKQIKVFEALRNTQ